MTAPENTGPVEGQSADLPASTENAAPETTEVVMEAAPADEKAPEASESAPKKADAAEVSMEAAVEEDKRLGKSGLKVGQKVEVKLIQVGEKDCFVDFGGTGEASVATAELKDKEGAMRVEVGTSFHAYVKDAGENPVFTLSLRGGTDTLALATLEAAFEQKMPVQGKIKKTNKGGLEVDLQGVRAFCPFSQVDVGFVEKPEDFIGQTHDFRITGMEPNGKNIVVSRRKLLEAGNKARAGETRKELEVGMVRDGVVRRLQPYGAFVDIGGLDGLVHVSEISVGHINSPNDVLKVGQKVQVQITSLENIGSKGERVSLSMKALAPDPWAGLEDRLPIGEAVKGKVVRLAPFGAFVQVSDGVDGLLHISEISTGRLNHPGDVLKTGQELEVNILSVEPDGKRISLGMVARIAAPAGSASMDHMMGGGGGGGGGGRGGRAPRESKGPVHYRSESSPRRKPPEITEDMPAEDALELLRKRFKGKL